MQGYPEFHNQNSVSNKTNEKQYRRKEGERERTRKGGRERKTERHREVTVGTVLSTGELCILTLESKITREEKEGCTQESISRSSGMGDTT